MKVVGIKGSVSYLQALKYLKTKKVTKRLKEIEKLVDTLITLAPYAPEGSKIETIRKNYAKISFNKLRQCRDLKLDPLE